MSQGPDLTVQRASFRGYVVAHGALGWWVCCAIPHCPETLGAMTVAAIEDALAQSWVRRAGHWTCPQCVRARP